MTDMLVDPAGRLRWRGRNHRCALGRGGVLTAKVEGDGATPAGRHPLRRVLYRPDRVTPPVTGLPVAALSPNDGWCDDPAHGDYNRMVRLPHPARCEALWRDDAIYDVIVVLGYNDDPVVAGRGSAIFLHVARPGYASTEGCVALSLPDLLTVLRDASAGDTLRVEPGP
ncbi:MAG: L,D-transpeptidase family protein [Rhodospirillales bacterium]|nr:L,D-transpeptidase family protein [Rhodospirillales bacterium]